MNKDLEQILTYSVDEPSGNHKEGIYTYKWEKLYRRNVVIFFYSIQDDGCKVIPTINATSNEISQVKDFADRSESVSFSMELESDEIPPDPAQQDQGVGDLSTEPPENHSDDSDDSDEDFQLELNLDDDDDDDDDDEEPLDSDEGPIDLEDEDASRKMESRYIKRNKLLIEASEEQDFDVHSVMKLKVLVHEVPVDRSGETYKGYKFEVMLMTPGESKGELIFEFTASPLDFPIPAESIKKLILDELILRNQYLTLEKENQFTKFCEKLHVMIDSKIRFLPKEPIGSVRMDSPDSIHGFSESASILSRISNFLK